jgi:hypothetical protein
LDDPSFVVYLDLLSLLLSFWALGARTTLPCSQKGRTARAAESSHLKRFDKTLPKLEGVLTGFPVTAEKL